MGLAGCLSSPWGLSMDQGRVQGTAGLQGPLDGSGGGCVREVGPHPLALAPVVLGKFLLSELRPAGRVQALPLGPGARAWEAGLGRGLCAHRCPSEGGLFGQQSGRGLPAVSGSTGASAGTAVRAVPSGWAPQGHPSLCWGGRDPGPWAGRPRPV